jgi:hypothetical protein
MKTRYYILCVALLFAAAALCHSLLRPLSCSTAVRSPG